MRDAGNTASISLFMFGQERVEVVRDCHPVAVEIQRFFLKVFELKTHKGYRYADYKNSWLKHIGLRRPYPAEAAAARTTDLLQQHIAKKFGPRIRIEAPVAEDMSLKFLSKKDPAVIEALREESIDSNKLQAFDILDTATNCAFEISLSDAFAEFFKDVLKSLLDSRVKKLYFCARNHLLYRGTRKSGFVKVRDSSMIRQYIALARLYKLDIEIIDLFPACNRPRQHALHP
jgi:hypothetical protein